MNLKIAKIGVLLVMLVFGSFACSKIEGPNFPDYVSPRAVVQAPASPASGIVAVSFNVIDKEKEAASIAVEFSINGGGSFSTCTLVNSSTTGLATEWYPGTQHTVYWDSVTDMVGRSADATVTFRVIASDASNPTGGTPGTAQFTVNNLAFNTPPAASVTTPTGEQNGNVRIDYSLFDNESDTCRIVVHYSIDNGAGWGLATLAPAGDGLVNLTSSPGGTAHLLFWDSRANNVALSIINDLVKVRITPSDFNVGAPTATAAFTVNNTYTNNPPTVAITSGPANGSTVTEDSVTFEWLGTDNDGTISGYYYSMDQDPPDVWTTGTTKQFDNLSNAEHVFRVVAMDNGSALSEVAVCSFTVSAPNQPPTVTITSGPSGTIDYDDPTFIWSGSDADGTVDGYYYSMDHDPPDTWTTSTTWQATNLANGSHTFRVLAVDNEGANSTTIVSISFMVYLSPCEYHWTRRLGGDGDDRAFAVAIDSVGNVYITGKFYSTVDFAEDWGSSDLKTSDCESDIFITKINQDSSYGWTRRIGGNENDEARGIAVDSNGNVYVTGMFRDSVDFGADWGVSDEHIAVTANDMFVTKINGDSSYGWTVAEEIDNGTTIGWAITVDYSNNVYVVGESGLVMKLDTAGTCLWLREFISPKDVTTDCWGNLYLTGEFTGTRNFAQSWGEIDNKTSLGLSDIFMSKINSDGSYGWTRCAGSAGAYEYGYAVDVDPNGNAYFVGSFRYTVNFAADWALVDDKQCNGGASYLTKVNSDGSYGWTKQIGDDSVGDDIDISVVATDNSGNIYLTGGFMNTIDFALDWDNHDIIASGDDNDDDIFLTRINADGSYGWTKHIGSLVNERGSGIAVDINGFLYLTGYFKQQVDFAEDWCLSDIKLSAGDVDVFLSKIRVK